MAIHLIKLPSSDLPASNLGKEGMTVSRGIRSPLKRSGGTK